MGTHPAVVTLGETIALLTAPSGRGVRSGSALPAGIGGAESNLAIGLVRLDVPISWICRWSTVCAAATGTAGRAPDARRLGRPADPRRTGSNRL